MKEIRIQIRTAKKEFLKKILTSCVLIIILSSLINPSLIVLSKAPPIRIIRFSITELIKNNKTKICCILYVDNNLVVSYGGTVLSYINKMIKHYENEELKRLGLRRIGDEYQELTLRLALSKTVEYDKELNNLLNKFISVDFIYLAGNKMLIEMILDYRGTEELVYQAYNRLRRAVNNAYGGSMEIAGVLAIMTDIRPADDTLVFRLSGNLRIIDYYNSLLNKTKLKGLKISGLGIGGLGDVIITLVGKPEINESVRKLVMESRDVLVTIAKNVSAITGGNLIDYRYLLINKLILVNKHNNTINNITSKNEFTTTPNKGSTINNSTSIGSKEHLDNTNTLPLIAVIIVLAIVLIPLLFYTKRLKH